MTIVRKRWLRLVTSGAQYAVGDLVLIADDRRGEIVAVYPYDGREQTYSVKTSAGFSKVRQQNLSPLPKDPLTGVNASGYSCSVEKSATLGSESE